MQETISDGQRISRFGYRFSGEKCGGWQETLNKPCVTQYSSLIEPTQPWQIVHIGFAGPNLVQMLLVMVNAEVLIRNNGTHLESYEFKDLMKE